MYIKNNASLYQRFNVVGVSMILEVNALVI